MAYEIQGRLENGFGLTAARDLVLERSGKANDRRLIGGAFKITTITSAQLLALFGTPITIVPAQGAGIYTILKDLVIVKPAGTAYAGIAAGEDLVARYTDASGAQCSSVIETTGFLDQTTLQARRATGPASTGSTDGATVLVANAAIVLHLLVGEITTGTSPLYVHATYDVINSAITS